MDMISYIMGYEKGQGSVVVEEGADLTFTDADTDGNIVITKTESEEVTE